MVMPFGLSWRIDYGRKENTRQRMNCPSLCGQYKKHPYVGNIKLSGVA
jgi:hypothetical protein